MKHPFLTIAIALLVASTAFCANPKKDWKTIAQAEELIAQKKYLSAYQLLDKYDPRNENSEIVLKKEYIVLNYFVSNMMNQIFALKDIEADKSIQDYRNNNGSYSMFFFSIDTILMNLAAKDSSDCRIFKGLGDYYYITYENYGNNWINGDDLELLNTALKNYQKAERLGCADSSMSFKMGMAYILQGDDANAISYYEKSLQQGMKNNADLHYNLGYAYMQTEKNKALEHAEKSFQLYTDSVLKSEAARMTGYIHIQNNGYAKAILYLKNADKLNPKDYYTWKLLLQSYIATKSPETATMTENLYMLDPKNYNIYNDLMSIYYTTDETQLPQLLHLFKTQLKQQTSNTVLLNLNFAIGNAEFHTGDKKNAKTYLLKAKELIAQESDPDEEMSEVLDDLILRCK